MKWESAPLWPVAFPSLTGFILAFIPYLFEIDFFTKKNLLFPVFILAILGFSCFLLTEKYGNKVELYIGYIFGLLSPMIGLGTINVNFLNVTYNLADFVSKILFGLIIWNAARQDT